MSDIEHHWHEPTQGQVMKALYQYLTDAGVNETKLTELIDKKLEEIVSRKVQSYVDSGRFNELLIAAVCHYVSNEKKAFERNGYGFANRIRNFVEEQLKELVIKNYKIQVVEKRETP